jgi:integrase
MRIAEAIQAKRKLESVADEHGIQDSSRLNGDFVDYCRKIGVAKPSPNTQLVWKNAIEHLTAFGGDIIPFRKINEAFLSQFKDYLLQHVNANSAGVYMARIKTGCRQAVNEQILTRYPGAAVTIRKQDTRREYLTLDELRKLQRTPCSNDAVKWGFLFSAFSGLRYSDVRALTQDKVKANGRETVLEFTEIKTGAVETLPLSDEAAAILKKHKDENASAKIKIEIPEDAVFKLPAQQTCDKAVKKWVKAAGIQKKISFHCARHTFATLGLKHGVDLYTMSKLLGHRRIETTQIYAKVVDESKQEAVKMLPRLNSQRGK